MAKKKAVKKHAGAGTKERAQDCLAMLKKLSSSRTLEEMGPRYGIHTKKAFGVSMANMKMAAKKLGQDHELALALWETGWYEARMVACMVDDPAQVTSAQMDAWCNDFDNWGICDTVCFKLFDQVPGALGKVRKWAKRDEEFVKRGAFALLACVALHNKKLANEEFAEGLELIVVAASDERNFVKKGVVWALRGIGSRNAEMRQEALMVAERLMEAESAAARWVGKTALKELSGNVAKKRAEKK